MTFINLGGVFLRERFVWPVWGRYFQCCFYAIWAKGNLLSSGIFLSNFFSFVFCSRAKTQGISVGQKLQYSIVLSTYLVSNIWQLLWNRIFVNTVWLIGGNPVQSFSCADASNIALVLPLQVSDPEKSWLSWEGKTSGHLLPTADIAFTAGWKSCG